MKYWYFLLHLYFLDHTVFAEKERSESNPDV